MKCERCGTELYDNTPANQISGPRDMICPRCEARWRLPVFAVGCVTMVAGFMCELWVLAVLGLLTAVFLLPSSLACLHRIVRFPLDGGTTGLAILLSWVPTFVVVGIIVEGGLGMTEGGSLKGVLLLGTPSCVTALTLYLMIRWKLANKPDSGDDK